MTILRKFFLFGMAAQVCGADFLSLDHASIGIYATRSKGEKPLVDQGGDLSLVPSSCMKIVTTAAALHLLGPKHRFETLLETSGSLIEEGILHGNLYIRGGGDPCLGSGRVAGSLPWVEQIRAWADAVEKLGIRKIEGRVLGDAGLWEKALAPPSWSWEDLGNYYGAGASALSFHENRYRLVFKPGKKAGDAAAICRTDPPLPHLSIRNEVKTGPAGSGDQACIYGSEFSWLQFVRGTVPAAVEEFAIQGAIPDPAETCAGLLAEELLRRGIAVEGNMIAGEGRRVPFHTTFSPTVQEIVHWTNRESVNLYAEHLLKHMGMHSFKEGSTEAGIRAVMTFWESQGIDLSGFQMVDGSGLSRKNLATAKCLVELLLKMREAIFFGAFVESLPEPEKGIRAKSGSMSLMKGYAGYTGDTAFAVLVNQCKDRKALQEGVRSALFKIGALKKEL